VETTGGGKQRKTPAKDMQGEWVSKLGTPNKEEWRAKESKPRRRSTPQKE
jgi:hypothetical protein